MENLAYRFVEVAEHDKQFERWRLPDNPQANIPRQHGVFREQLQPVDDGGRGEDAIEGIVVDVGQSNRGHGDRGVDGNLGDAVVSEGLGHKQLRSQRQFKAVSLYKHRDLQTGDRRHEQPAGSLTNQGLAVLRQEVLVRCEPDKGVSVEQEHQRAVSGQSSADTGAHGSPWNRAP